MKTILFSIDFNEATKELTDNVIQFASEMNAKVYLLHVASLDIGFVIADMGFQYLPELEQTELKREGQELQQIKKDFDAQNIVNEVILTQGVPSESIVEKAEELQVDYIVMGMHSKGFIMDAILGSVTKEVLKKSTQPVLIFPSKSV